MYTWPWTCSPLGEYIRFQNGNDNFCELNRGGASVAPCLTPAVSFSAVHHTRNHTGSVLFPSQVWTASRLSHSGIRYNPLSMSLATKVSPGTESLPRLASLQVVQVQSMVQRCQIGMIGHPPERPVHLNKKT